MEPKYQAGIAYDKMKLNKKETTDISDFFAETGKLYKWIGYELYTVDHRPINVLKRSFYIVDVISTPILLLIGALLAEDLVGITESLVTAIIVFNSATKFFTINRNEHKVVEVYNILRALIKVQLQESEEHCQILLSGKAKIDWLQKMFLRVFGFSVSIAIVNSMINTIRDPLKPSLPLRMWIPFEYGSVPYLIFGFSFQTIGCALGVLSFTFCYMTFASFIINISTQIDILIDNIKTVGNGTGASDSRETMRSWVHHHQIVLRLVKTVNEVFGNVLNLEIVLSSFQTCLVAFNCSKRPLTDPKQTFFASLFLTTIVTPFSICWCGELLSTKSQELYNAVYDSGWYKMNPNQRREIAFVLTQTRKDLTLNARDMFQMNLARFLATIQTAYSYLAMLTSVDN